MELVPGTDDQPMNPGVKLTYEDFLLFPNDGRRHELIDGEHYVTPAPNWKHQGVSGNMDRVRVFRLSGSRFGRPLELSAEGGDVLTSPLFPGLELPLADIFRF
jgi:Uma2 family endonuclease